MWKIENGIVEVKTDPVKLNRLNSISKLNWKLIPKFKELINEYYDRLDDEQIEHLYWLYIYNPDIDNLRRLIEDVLSDNDIPVFKFA
jgi:hypothetical protein